MARYLEDLKAGDAFESRRHTITEEEIIEFARRYDPQPFHMDPEAAKKSFFGKLVASGWHTAALTMKMLTESQMELAGGIIGAGMDSVKWPVPLVPGDTIHVRIEILAVRASKSRPEIGIVQTFMQTLREDGAAVQEMTGTLVVPTRPA